MDFAIKYGADLFFAVILVLSIVDCARKGFVKSILSLIAVFVALAAAMQFSQPVAQWGYDTFASKVVVNKVEAAMPEGFDSDTAAEAVKGVVKALPDYLKDQLKELGIDFDKISEDIEKQDISAQSTAEQISEKIIKPGAVVLLKMLCYILIFLIVRGILEFFIGLINKFFTLPVLKTANKWLGAALGAVKGVIVVLVLCVVINALSGIVADKKFGDAIENSRVAESVSEMNLGNFSVTSFLENSK